MMFGWDEHSHRLQGKSQNAEGNSKISGEIQSLAEPNLELDNNKNWTQEQGPPLEKEGVCICPLKQRKRLSQIERWFQILSWEIEVIYIQQFPCFLGGKVIIE